MSKPGRIHERIVEILKRFPEGRTCGQVRLELEKEGLRPDEQTYLDKRMRELPRWYNITRTRAIGGSGSKRQSVVVYVYESDKAAAAAEGQVSQRVRAEVLRFAHGRCQMCGRTVERHGVTLVVDHRRPRDWGGSNERDNLWAICEPCNGGKKAHFSSLNLDAAMMTKVMESPSVHVRIGEALKAAGVGNRTTAEILDIAADQEDWPKRLRELRYPVIGWEIDTIGYKNEAGKKRVDYILQSYKPWPDDPTGKIRQFERDRKRRNEKS
jgi:hypothetical protein